MTRVLIVDDVPDLRDFLSEALFEAGFDVATTACVYEAQEFLRRDELHCAVVLDLGLPDVPGQHLLDWIRSHPAHRAAPVIIITGNADVRAVPGSTALLIKPIDVAVLVRILAQHHARCTN